MNQRDFRIQAGMTLAEFGRRVGIHEQTVWRYENGRVPNPKIMRKIIEVFGESIDINTYYKRKHCGTLLRSSATIAVSFAIILSFSSFAYSASYEELIFCSRWYAGVHSALVASGEGDSVGAKSAQIEGRMFGYRALAATPEGELPNALRVIDASNNAVNQILATGRETDWQHIHRACGELK